MALSNWEFELTPGLVAGLNPPLKLTDFDPGEITTRDQDTINPYGENRWLGRDRVTPPTWTLQMMALGSTAHTTVQQVVDVVTAPLEPGVDVAVTYRINNRDRVARGRFRNFKATPLKGIPDRAVELTVDFVHTHYVSLDAALSQVVLRFSSTSQGGFTVPVTVPIVVHAAPGSIQGNIPDVGGTAPAAFTATIYGPITNPWLAGRNWRMNMTTELLHNQSATVDTLNNTILRNDGASLAGTLDRYSRLSGLRLKPGSDFIQFGGTDSTGNSRAVVTWHKTYKGF